MGIQLDNLLQRKNENNHKQVMKNLWETLNERKSKTTAPTEKTNIELDANRPQRVVAGHDVTLAIREKIKDYLSDIEKITGVTLNKSQRNLIQRYIKTHKVVKLDSKERQKSRAEFNKLRTALRTEWEEKTGLKWPVYKENIIVNGKVVRKAGNAYDAHHIVEVSYGGPHKWWNLVPAKYPSQHQDGIHEDGSVASQIYGPLGKELHCSPTDKPNEFVNRK